MYLSYCTATPKLKSADINIYTIDLVTIFTGTLLVQMGGTLYVSTDSIGTDTYDLEQKFGQFQYKGICDKSVGDKVDARDLQGENPDQE